METTTTEAVKPDQQQTTTMAQTADTTAKAVDPFAALSTKKEDKSNDNSKANGDNESGKDDGKTKTAGDTAAGKSTDKASADDKSQEAGKGDKKVAGKKQFDPQERIKQQNDHISKITSERDSYKKQVEELTKKGGGDVTALTSKISELEAQNKKLQGELSAKDYSKHPDFQKNFEQPFLSAANTGKKIFESLEIIEKDENGEVKSKRTADWKKDFSPIYNLPRAAARARAKELFGDDVDAISSTMAQYDKIHEADENRSKALTEWETGASEREQKDRAEQLKRVEESTKAFHAATNDMIEAKPELFRDNPEDAEEVELRKKGMGLVDAAYFGRDKMSPKEQLLLDAAIRLRAGNFLVMEHRLQKAMAELAEYKARIDGKEESRTGKTRRTGQETTTNEPEDWRADFRKTVGG